MRECLARSASVRTNLTPHTVPAGGWEGGRRRHYLIIIYQLFIKIYQKLFIKKKDTTPGTAALEMAC